MTTAAQRETTTKFTLDEAKAREGIAAGQTSDEGICSSPDLWSVSADDLNRLMDEAFNYGAIRGPEGYEILIYPESSQTNEAIKPIVMAWHNDSHVDVATHATEIKKIIPRELWESDDRDLRTIKILEELITLGNSVLHQVAAALKANRIRQGEQAPSGERAFYTVVGLYEGDGGRFCDDFEATSPDDAESQAHAFAAQRSTEMDIAAVFKDGRIVA